MVAHQLSALGAGEQYLIKIGRPRQSEVRASRRHGGGGGGGGVYSQEARVACSLVNLRSRSDDHDIESVGSRSGGLLFSADAL